MKKLVATAPRVAALVEYEDRAVEAHEVKIRARFGAPKHGTEVVDFRAASPFIDEEFNAEWQMFTPREEGAARGIEFGKFQLGNMIVGDIIECGADVTGYQTGDRVCCYGPLQETVIVNAVNNYKLRKMPQGASWKNAVCYDPAQFAMSGVRMPTSAWATLLSWSAWEPSDRLRFSWRKKLARQLLSALIRSNTAARSPVVTVRTTA